MVTKVSSTPFDVAVLKCAISCTERGAAMRAPPPKPVMAIPVAMPGDRGTILISVETGEM